MKLLNHASLNQETDSSGLNRRSFLTATGGAVVGLVVGFAGPAAKFAAAGGSPAAINPFVRIGPDGTVTVLVKHLDKGQGTLSALTTLVAEELDADWDSMRAEFAPADNKLYNNLFWGETQGTGGSSGVPNSFMQYRQAGAAAKAMLRAAASKAWGVPPGEVKVAEVVLSHASGKTASFGEMAAAEQPTRAHAASVGGRVAAGVAEVRDAVERDESLGVRHAGPRFALEGPALGHDTTLTAPWAGCR